MEIRLKRWGTTLRSKCAWPASMPLKPLSGNISPGNRSAMPRRNSALVLHKNVEIKGYGLGPNNRIIGEIFIDGNNINHEMLRAGLAEVYEGKSPESLDLEPYRRLETEARDAGRGIWSQGKKYIPPRIWRRKQRN